MLPLADWRSARLAALTAADGWLNLVARIDLVPGRHLVGATQDVRLPSGPDLLGTLDLSATGASFARPGRVAEPFHPEIHTVDGTPALRVRDLTLMATVDLRHFPEVPDWTLRAKWESVAPEPTEIRMKDGSITNVTVTHRATFEHEGRVVSMTPTHWKSGTPMFVFRDATAGETYPACRFLFGEDLTDSEITLDFNRAMSPPCAFTDFAICPLPPPSNILPFRIEAGELMP